MQIGGGAGRMSCGQGTESGYGGMGVYGGIEQLPAKCQSQAAAEHTDAW